MPSLDFYKEQNKIKKLILDKKLDKLFIELFDFNEKALKNEFVNYIKNKEEKETDENNKAQYKIIKTLYNHVSPKRDCHFDNYHIDTEMGWDFHLYRDSSVCLLFDLPKIISDAMKNLNVDSITSKFTKLNNGDNNEDTHEYWGYLNQITIDDDTDANYNIYGCIVPTLGDDYINILKKINLLKKKVAKQDEKENLHDVYSLNRFVVLINDFVSDSITFDDVKKIFWETHRIHLLKISLEHI
jgi:hypothetical protein